MGDSAMARMMREFDWSASPLGPVSGWPESLCTAVSICLTSRHPMVVWWGPELVLLYNDAWTPILGDRHPEGLGRRGADVWPEMWHFIGAQMRSVLATGQATWSDDQLLPTTRSGFLEEAYFTYSFSPVHDHTGAVGGVFTAVTETTGRVLGERRIKALGALGEISAVSAPTVDEACVAATGVLGGARADVPFGVIYLLDETGSGARQAASFGMVDDPERVPTALSRDSGHHPTLWRVMSTGQPVVLTGVSAAYPGCFGPAGGPMGPADPELAVGMPLPDSGGRPLGVLFAGVSPFLTLDEEYRRFLDLVARQVGAAITDARSLQAQRRRAEELAELDRAKTEFFTGVSHELRTPLTLITGPAQDALADAEHPLPGAQYTRLELISRNAARLRRLVDTIVEFSQLEAGRLVPAPIAVDLAGLTRGIAESFAPAVHRAGLAFHIDCPPLSSGVSVDPLMWEKVVLNLLSNAVKYTLDGEVTLSLARTATGAVRMRVADTGIGVPAEEHPKLFERFHRVRGAAGRSHEGSGIGLALVAELTAQHRGTVSVDSAPGRGATFTVELPAGACTDAPGRAWESTATAGFYREEALQWSGPTPVPDPAASDTAESDTAESDTAESDTAETAVDGTDPDGRRTVLVIEDNADLRGFLADVLGPHYRVVLADDGERGVRLAGRHRPDLVLADVMMPKLDGFGVLGALRADPATSGLPVILLSARAGQHAISEGLAAGADDYLVKPFSSYDLLARVQANMTMARSRLHEGAWRTAMLNALSDGLFVADAAGNVIEVNDAFGEMLGYGPEGLPYPPPHPWWPDPEDRDAYQQLRRALGPAVSVGHGRWKLWLRHRDGRPVFVDIATDAVDLPADEAGSPVSRARIVGIVRDVTDQYRAGERDRVLAESARVFTEPGTLDDRIDELTRVLAAGLDELVMIARTGPDGRMPVVAASHPGRPDLADRMRAHLVYRVPEGPAGDHQAVVLDAVPEEAVRAAVDGDAAYRARVAAGLDATVVAPLTVSGRRLGVLSVVATSAGRTFGPADLQLVQELARRIAALIDADRLAVRERTLHDASNRLASATTVAEAAEVLVAAAVESLGPAVAAVYTVRPGDPGRLHLEHGVGFPAGGPAPSTVRLDDPFVTCRAVRTGRPVWVGDPAEVERLPRHAEMPVARAVAAVPLRTGDRSIGAITLTFATAREFPAQEREFAATLAAQAAQAFARATLSDVQRDIAHTLQHSLLPARIPDLARLAVATSYRPAGRYSQAGGDWYDIIPLDADQVAIAVGDVVGSGTTAAAVMGQLRSALAAALIGFRSPARALELLSRYTERVEGAVASTALCLVVNTRTGVLRWAAAGHPPPVLLDPRGPAGGADIRGPAGGADSRGPAGAVDSRGPAGGASFLRGGRGPVLGHHRAPGARPGYVEATATIAPGCTVLLYTDGLVERRGEHVDRSLDRLLRVLGPAASTPIGGLLDLVQSRLLGARQPADDVAIVAARLLPAPLRSRLPATPEQLSGIRRRVRRWADEAGLSARSVQDLQLALGEALANSIEHAYPPDEPGELGYRIEHTGRGVFGVEVVDEGRWRPRTVVDTSRGRGLFMIRALADDVVVDGTDRGTTVRFTVRDPVVEPVAATGSTSGLPAAAPGLRESVAPAGLRTETRPGHGTVLWLTGDLDLDGTEALRPELVEQLSRHPGRVRLDVSEVSYLGSAGIRLLGEVTGRDPCRIEVHAANGSRAARVLRMAGL